MVGFGKHWCSQQHYCSRPQNARWKATWGLMGKQSMKLTAVEGFARLNNRILRRPAEFAFEGE